MGSAIAVASIVVLVAIGGFCSVAETVVTRVSRVRAHHLAQERKTKGSQLLVRIVEDPAPYLNVLLLLTVASYVVASVIAAGVSIAGFGGTGQLVAVAVMTLVIFVFAEAAPRTFAVQRLERAALLMARPTYLLGRALQPLGRLLILISNAVMLLVPGRPLPKGPFVTEDEIKHMVDLAEEEEEIEEEERELIHSIFEFGDTVVREVMVPRTDMVAIRSDASLEKALETIVRGGYSRIPIYEGDTDNIVGVLYAKDLLKRTHEGDHANGVRALGRAPLFVPEQKKVAELLREMQQRRVHMAIVVDEYGGTAGLVTIEDVLEEIVGEIVDEYDREEPLVEPIDDDTIRVDAKMPIDEVNELFGVELPHEEWDTVGGLVFGLCGRVPATGETVRFDSLEFRTERVSGRRIQKVLITRVEPEPAQEPE